MKRFLIIICSCFVCMLAINSYAIKKKSNKNIITLNEAISKTLKSNYQLKAAKLDIELKNNLIRNARLIPNPELEIVSENFVYGENEIMLNQLFELGGKRAKRLSVFEKNKELAIIDYNIGLAKIVYEVKIKYLDCLLIQKKLKLLEKVHKLNEDILKSCDKRNTLGSGSSVEIDRANIKLAMSKFSQLNLHKEYRIAKKNLAVMWESTVPDFDTLLDEILIPKKIPSLSELQKTLQNNLNLKRQNIILNKKENEVQFNKALRVPDLSIGFGYKRIFPDDENVFIFSLGIGLPIFNRNQGEISAAWIDQKIESKNLASLKNNLECQIANLYEDLIILKKEVALLENEILPMTNKSYTKLEKYYKLGKVSYLELMDTQKQLIKIESSLLDSKLAFSKKQYELEKDLQISFDNM
ncbi:MAG: TolC family protein [Pseudomonadota bacterium]